MWLVRVSRGWLLAGASAVAAGTTLLAAAVGSSGDKDLRAEVTAAPTAWNRALLARMPTAAAPYHVPLLLRNGHLETMFAAKFRQRPHLLYDREMLHMPDGGCVCLDTEPHQVRPQAASQGQQG
jgi:hypothetical protein